jgi:DNA-binding transcriptional MerR regulator
VTESSPRYAIGDLADLAGVSRRTVRYYVQESLLPPPHGVGRGSRYGAEHLHRILQVKSWQEAGRTLDQIRRALGSPAAAPARLEPPPPEPPLPRTVWQRFELAPGVELHVSRDIRLPAPGKLRDLAAWCRLHFASGPTMEHTDAND